jgi:hypothetical protein
MWHCATLTICLHIVRSLRACFQIEGEVAETLILMEFADLGSLDHYAARTSFKGNLVCQPNPHASSSPFFLMQADLTLGLPVFETLSEQIVHLSLCSALQPNSLHPKLCQPCAFKADVPKAEVRCRRAACCA